MSIEKKRMLSGVKPTGRVHIGNYFGAMRQFVELQNKYETYVFIPNYHAMNSVQDKGALSQQTLEVAFDYLAIGLDPEKVTLYIQSDVPEVTELTWIFNTITTVPYLQRAHAYKDATAKGQEVGVGTFDYPILMAADILIQDGHIVPVGKDQKQHVEYARDIAEKFNRVFGETFVLPEAYILEDVEIIPGIDGRKMSKSYNNVIPLFGSDDEVTKAVMSIPTDSRAVEEPKDPEECNVFYYHKLFAGDALPEIERRYREGGLGYKESKEILIEEIITFIKPLREKRATLANGPEHVMKILKRGGDRARARAEDKMKRVRERCGILTTY